MARVFTQCLAAVLVMLAVQESRSKRVVLSQDTIQLAQTKNSSYDEEDHLFTITHQANPVVGGAPLKLMSLNVEFYTEMCDKGLTKGIQQCFETKDTKCEQPVTQMLCCNTPGKDGTPGGLIREACRAQKCYDVGNVDSETWPSYENPTPTDKEPLCLQGARNLLTQVVSIHKPHVVATQEDFENYPLRVPNYVTIISANSHAMWYIVKPRTKELKQNGQVVHMVNSLLVHKDLFNLDETKKLCEGKPGHVFDEFEPGKFYRCGLDLRSPEAAAKKAAISGGEQIEGWKNDDGPEDAASKLTVKRIIPDDADEILLMASRCAAFAAVGSTGQHVVVASAHLTGGRFDDDLIGIENKEVEELQMHEKTKQITNLIASLNSQSAPSIIMGDFNGPDDFDIQWWKVLTAPWPATHPALGSIFGGKVANMEALGPVAELAKDDKNLPFLHTDHPRSIWANHPKLAQLSAFEAAYKTWMVGMHEHLRAQGWNPLTTSKDFTTPFGKVQGTTSKFGGAVDFFYASPGFVGAGKWACKKPKPQAVDFSNGKPMEKVMVKACKTPKKDAKGVTAFQVEVVNGVLKRSTDHAPVLVEVKVV